jgi:hypothetical protein
MWVTVLFMLKLELAILFLQDFIFVSIPLYSRVKLHAYMGIHCPCSGKESLACIFVSTFLAF